MQRAGGEGAESVPPYLLVATDLDGTLLDGRGEVTPHVKETIQAVCQAGVKVCLATSRRLTGAAPVARAVELSGPLIVYDGALVWDFPSGGALHAESLEASVAQSAVEAMAGHGLRPVVQRADRDGERLFIGPPPAGDGEDALYLRRFAAQVVELPVAELCVGRPDPLRLVAFGALDRLRSAADEIGRLPCATQLVARGNYGAAELTVFSPAASKGNALVWLARHLDVPLARTFAIGDGVNDVSLLQAAGYGVAMANGEEATKAAASAITGSNDEDGLACALERYVLGRDRSVRRADSAGG